MCEDAGIRGKTNHSMRASGATTMFQNNAPKCVIQSVREHRSLDSLRAYEQISTAQHTEVSKILMSNHTTVESSGSGGPTKSDLSGFVFTNCSTGHVNIM